MRKCWACGNTEFWLRGKERICSWCHPKPAPVSKGQPCPYHGSVTCQEDYCSGCEFYQQKGEPANREERVNGQPRLEAN